MSSMTSHRYATMQRWLHWSIFALVLAAYVAVNLHDVLPHGSAARANVLVMHYVAGAAVLLLMLPRLAARFIQAPPPIVPPLGSLSHASSRLTHLALYLFLIVQPIMGIVTLLIAGKPVSLFGITILPALLGPGNRELAHRWEDIHGTVGTLFYYVIGLHILGALWHHFGRKDNTLRRML